MLPVFTAVEMRALDARAISTLDIPGAQLMERAGTGAADLIARTFAPIGGKHVSILCGKGNNGGDGFVVARRLRAKGANVQTVLVARRDEVGGDARAALKRFRGRVSEIGAEADLDRLARDVGRAHVVVDALLGTGLTGPARGLVARSIELINAAKRPVVSLDLPSGLGSDTGVLLGATVRASLTTTFAGYKRSLLLHPGAACAGRVVAIDIGIAPDEVARGIATFLLEEGDARAHFPKRTADAHKGSYGHLLVVAGSLGKTGAAAIAARAALRSGVGLCTIATPRSQQPVVAAMHAETDDRAAGRDGRAGDRARRASGDPRPARPPRRGGARPGPLTRPRDTGAGPGLVAEVTHPMVVDADALSALAGHLDVLDRAAGPRVLTPHPGEMARLLGTTVAEVQGDRLETTRAFARQHRVYLALKGAGTVVAAPDGRVFDQPHRQPGNGHRAAPGTCSRA